MVQVTYRKRTQGKSYLSPNNMQSIRSSSHFDYTAQKAELDRRIHFGELKQTDRDEKEGD